MQINVNWEDGLAFNSNFPSGHKLMLDANPESGGQNKGPRPMEVMLSGLAGCTGIDIVLILKKMKVELESFELEVEAERAAEIPRRFTKIKIHYKLKGKNLTDKKVARAIELSQEKYCSASNSLNAEISSDYEIEITD
ncbi:OsmC family protein [Halanaerobium salsuginis]|uniref:Putative redox protein n=1 Tax=Halanaerobium salsuginis TaxID=29563 RepID=A0A1I4GYU9_9FIRM|nr:OsmC family protein [Halanaerobium salsuginis]SFL34326.1 putative redox protein [Halanaerobium salsuginis]